MGERVRVVWRETRSGLMHIGRGDSDIALCGLVCGHGRVGAASEANCAPCAIALWRREERTPTGLRPDATPADERDG